MRSQWRVELCNTYSLGVQTRNISASDRPHRNLLSQGPFGLSWSRSILARRQASSVGIRGHDGQALGQPREHRCRCSRAIRAQSGSWHSRWTASWWCRHLRIRQSGSGTRPREHHCRHSRDIRASETKWHSCWAASWRLRHPTTTRSVSGT
jgi:hypothetical protein